MPLTEKEFSQIETAIKCMDVVNLMGKGYLISQQNVLCLISKFALLGKDKPREGCCGGKGCSEKEDPEEDYDEEAGHQHIMDTIEERKLYP